MDVDARKVFRQEDSWVDLPPRVLVKAFNNAWEKENASPIIYEWLWKDRGYIAVIAQPYFTAMWGNRSAAVTLLGSRCYQLELVRSINLVPICILPGFSSTRFSRLLSFLPKFYKIPRIFLEEFRKLGYLKCYSYADSVKHRSSNICKHQNFGT